MAYCMPKLLGAAKPRLSALRTSRALGKFAATKSADPSVESLSQTYRSACTAENGSTSGEPASTDGDVSTSGERVRAAEDGSVSREPVCTVPAVPLSGKTSCGDRDVPTAGLSPSRPACSARGVPIFGTPPSKSAFFARDVPFFGTPPSLTELRQRCSQCMPLKVTTMTRTFFMGAGLCRGIMV